MLIRLLRAAVAFLLRRMPEGTKGRIRLLTAADERLTHSSPLVSTTMRLGYRMHLDLRSRMESLAYFTGGHEETLVRGALAVLPAGGVALDVGANIGFWSVPLAASGLTVHAYEPLAANAARLRINAAENGVEDQITIHQRGLSDEPGSATLRVLEDPERGPSTGNAALDVETLAVAGVEQIPLTTLDADVAALGLDRIDLVKVDIEGHENAFLRGARQTLARFRPVMWVEWNGFIYGMHQGDPAAEIAAELTELDYAVLGRVEGRWTVLDRFFSPLPLDDLVAVPAERRDEVLAAIAPYA